MSLTRIYFAAALTMVGLWTPNALAILTGEYLFEGGNADDTSGFNRDGTIQGGSGFTAGLYQGSTQALLQTATGQSISLPPNTDFIRNAPGATLLAWVRADNLTDTAARNIVVVNHAGTAARALLEWHPDNGFRAIGRQLDSGGSTIINSGTGAAVAGETYFLAGVFDYVNGDIFLYIDGQPVASNTNTGWNANSADTANSTTRIGSHWEGATQHWIGAIDGVRIFDNTMTAQQIFDLYLAESSSPLLPGDTDGNGDVELVDLTPIRTNWLQSVSARTGGDLVDDDVVNLLDFRQWKTAYLETVEEGGGSLAGVDLGFLSGVPEPTAIGLALVGLLGILVQGGRRRRGIATAAAVFCACLLAFPATSQATVSASADPAWPMGGVFTYDPWVEETSGQRGIDDTRMLRQTFQNPSTFTVGQIVIAMNVTSEPQGGMTMRIYEVEDVNATNWAPGSLLKELNYFLSLPDSAERLGFTLTGSDAFSLPARNTGTQGYGIEFSNVDAVSNTGVLRHTNAGTDFYTGGVFYIEGGGLSGGDATRDLGVALAAAVGGELDPGDVDGLNGPDLVDLSIIAANFRTNGGRSEGDLTGNGFIDLDDFREWKANYPGANSGGGGIGAYHLFGIPEPTSFVLLLAGLAGGAAVRRRGTPDARM